MKNKSPTQPIAYQTRHFSLALATTALTAADKAELERRSGLTMAQLLALKIDVLASFPDNAITAPPTSSQTATRQMSNTDLARGAHIQSPTAIDTEVQRQAEQFNAHRRAKASVDAAPRLYLSYFIHHSESENTADSSNLAAAVGWLDWQQQQVAFCDYLWEQSCLECFIGGPTTDYVEINANPAGAFALYHFSDYRQPDTMPPPPLYNHSPCNGNSKPVAYQQRASIDWQSDMLQNLVDDASAYPLASALSRHFSLQLAQLPAPLLPLSQLHPCVILMLGDIPLYFAPKHAHPPDFHNRAYWTTL